MSFNQLKYLVMMSFNKPLRVTFIILALYTLQSCYSVRIMTTKGVAEPDPLNQQDGFYKQKEVKEIKETIDLKILEKGFTLLEKCGDKGFHSIEYRNTFGGVLLSAVTFGKKRRVLIKYVCIKE